ncbi:PREDICTED: aspartyl protease family protein 1-like isoform X1 [Prunus mume]|uniref:Aspartyl protease family protein 1-like isoform X1 n=1 Tax=Prunus mume TaxID=102107 RepID=A0ABM0PN56_PRUMU|nr:PREDICTED: aspartyl protease family protein 1-like isoform X1 [Prunus mume]
MAFTCIRASSSSSFTATRLLVSVFILCWVSRTCSGFGSYGFDIHHRFSDPVKAILGSDELPEKGSAEYYAAMAHRDRLIRGRHLSTADETTPLTFVYGNETDRIGAFGHLHYANVSVGTPSTSYLVALDTGSNLLWLPCDCSSCVHGVKLSNGDVIEFEIYSPNTSSTSKKVSCNSTYCEQRQHCASAASDCQYKIEYLSNDTSSTGVLVEDVLHLTTDDAKQKDVNARIGFGCGKEQTGIFLNGAAPNGLLGLGMDDVSVPSILASQGLASNSFSMCFGLDGSGRISFGDNGSLDQAETPFNLKNRSAHRHSPIYNITITQIAIGESVTDLEFYAIFDSGTSFTYLNDPAYTQITENFNSALKNKRRSKDSSIPFEYCYDIRPNQTVNLTLKGGKQYSLLDPLVVLANEDGTLMFYCLGIVKSGDVNIIGQNFMTGYRVIFDRERMVLGWKEFDCYNVEDTVTLPGTKSKSWAAPPGHTVNPEAKAGSSNTSHITPPNH